MAQVGEVRFAFSTKHERKLRRLLTDAGITKSGAKNVERLRRAAESYRRVANTCKEVAAIESAARAERIADYAEALHHELKQIDDFTRTKMIDVMKHYDWEHDAKKPPRRRGRKVMTRCKSAAEDIVFAAGHAMTEASRRAWNGKRAPERALRRLCEQVSTEWYVATGRPLANTEYAVGMPRLGNGIGLRVIVRDHPLWVVLDALSINVDASTLSDLIDRANERAYRRRQKGCWRSPVAMPRIFS